MKKIIISLSLFILFNATGQNKKTLNLDEAVKIAIENRSILKAYKFATQASKESEKVAISGYLPQISALSTENFSTDSKGLQNSTTIKASQLLYSFAGPRQLKKIAHKGTEISKINEITQKDNVRFAVETAFLQTWLLQEKLKLIKKLNVTAKETIKKSEHQEKLQLLGQADWLKDASTYANNMANVYVYTDELYSAQNDLDYLLGDSYIQNNNKPILTWNPKEPIKLKSLNYYYNKAFKNRTEIKLKQKELEQYQEYQNYYKKTYLPNVSVTGQVSRADQLKANNAGVTLSWQLFDGASNYYESQKANANKLKALQEKQSYIQKAKNEVQQAFHDLITLKKQLTANTVELRRAKNEFDLAKLNYKIGNISKVDLDNAKYNWENSKYAWLTTKVSTAIKQRELFYVCGYPNYI
jgi:outer membrane protein